ncbi:MAG: hypothetical protein J5I50_05065 [Chitinophagaceae bacterium]|nr:hypothetical protein [Chitinophagaceae bacterium]
MNRRNFLRQTGTLSIALAGLPLAIRRNQEESLVVYSYHPSSIKEANVSLVLEIYNSAIKDFKNAPKDKRKVKFSYTDIVYNEKEDKRIMKRGDYILDILSAKLDEDPLWKGYYLVRLGNAVKTFGNLQTWPDAIPGKPLFRIRPNETADLFDRKDSIFRTLTTAEYDKQAARDLDDFTDGCFLTTACVQERGLADDCDELTTLRYLRENYMRNTAQGKVLLEEYNELGPQVVTAIAQYENHSEIYDYMYNHMILPAVAMIKKGEYQQAVDWYEGFSIELKKKYC